MTETITRHDQDLHLQGDCTLLNAPGRVTITGSRASTPYGDLVAREAGALIAQHGGVVIASSAYGIDSAAARGALAAGGRVILIQPAGLNRPYPRGTAELPDTVLTHGGLLASVQDDDAAPTRYAFLEAARMRGVLAHHTLVLEGAFRSGANGTATASSSVWACPGPITSAASALPHKLLAEGARIWTGDPADAAEMTRTA